MAEDELLDLVDDADNVIGTVLRSETMAKKLRNFRVINAFIRNDKGELWIPRRSASKRIFPLCLDISVGGHVGAGEPYDLAFERETEEEVGLKLADVSWRVLGHLSPVQHGVSAFMQVYEISHDAVPNYNRADFIEHWWLTPAQLATRIRGGDPAKGDLLQLVTHFYG
jgi:isopentenyl-diphosphate delta-isomerase